MIFALLMTGMGILFAFLAPSDAEKPIVIVYMHDDCQTCRRWMNHLAAHGFRPIAGKRSEWAAVRSRFKVPAGFRGRHIAIVDGLFLEGHVPAGDVHRVLNARNHARIKGLVVPGMPKGAPGLEAGLPQAYFVYAVHESGLLRPIATYHHTIHF